MNSYIILLAFLSICHGTILWRINVNPPAYLLGTVHLPNKLIWPFLSDTAKTAFYNSTHFLPEFDMTNFFLFTRFRMCMNSIETAKFKAISSIGFLNQDNSSSTILDMYLTLEARRLKKTVMALETADIYCEFTKFQIDNIMNNLTSTRKSSNMNEYEQMRKLYNCDLNCPEELFPPMPSFTADQSAMKFQQDLEDIVNRRDEKMAKMIDNLLKEGSPNKRYFFAVGFIHLMSSKGIVTKLRQNYHYSVTRLCTDPSAFRTTVGCFGPSWCDRLITS